MKKRFPPFFLACVFFASFLACANLLKLIPVFGIQSRKTMLESDLLYSARHLLLKQESGSSLINSLESVSKLRTKSSVFFKELLYDVNLGMPLEDAIKKSVESSPSKAYTKFLEEISSAMRTGADMQKALKAILDDVAKQHFIQIQEYGKKLNPMSMFYMIIGTILPSLGTAMLVVAASFLSGGIIIDIRALLFIASIVLIVQVFFILGFKSLKPSVME